MKYMKKIITLVLLTGTALLFMPAGINGQVNITINTDNSNVRTNDIVGFGILKRLPGLWNGPVTSTTSAGSFDRWYVDFRPVSAAQVSQFSMLDSQTVNITSFFIVKYRDRLRVAMRTEGCFAKKCCVTYEVLDSANEASGYYRFSDFCAGLKRAYTEFRFKENEFVMEVHTSKFNKVNPLQVHTHWETKLADRKAAADAISHFNYPQPVMIKDFSDAFKNMTESIFFSFENDPYNSSSQPYMGSVTVNIIIDKALKVAANQELCLLLTTEPLFEGLKYDPEKLKYISKYVYLPVGTKSYTIKNVHPGKYYIYSYDDLNNDKKHKSGDYMSSDIVKNNFSVPPNGNVEVSTTIDLIIP